MRHVPGAVGMRKGWSYLRGPKRGDVYCALTCEGQVRCCSFQGLLCTMPLRHLLC